MRMFCCLILLLAFLSMCAQPTIVDFNPKEHLKEVMDLIESEKELVAPTLHRQEIETMLVNAKAYISNFFTNGLSIKLLREDEKLVGLITYTQLFWFSRFIELLVVNKSFRGKGYGKQLLEYAARDAAKNKKTVLIIGGAYKKNKQAIEIYKKLGAQEKMPSKFELAIDKLTNWYRELRGKPQLPEAVLFTYDLKCLPKQL